MTTEEKTMAIEEADLNKDGTVTDTELELYKKISQLERQQERDDAQRKMAWFSLAGMLLYPFAVVLASYTNLDQAATILGDMAPTYFVSVAAIVAAFYAKEGYTKHINKPNL